MIQLGDPDLAALVVVAVERCNLFANDPLRGPVADAIAWIKWAETIGVPPARIRLFVSPKEASMPMLDGWLQTRLDDGLPKIEQQEATEALVVDFLTGKDPSSLAGLAPPEGTSGSLIFAWSGHGVVDPRVETRDRHLFFADAHSSHPRHVNVTHLSALFNQRHFRFDSRVLVMAACATSAAVTFRQKGIGRPVPLGVTEGAGLYGRQYTMAATAPGDTAENQPGADNVVRSSFLTLLFDQFGEPKPGVWPDIVAAFDRARAAFPEAKAAPASWFWSGGDGDFHDVGVDVLGTRRSTRLLHAILHANPDRNLLRDAFVAASPDKLGAASRLDAASWSAADLVGLLEESPRAGAEHDPLRCMAFEVLARMALGSGALSDWLRADGLDDAEIVRRVDARRRAHRTLPRFVLIDGMPFDDSTESVHAWLFSTPSASPRPLTRSDNSPFLVDATQSWPDLLGEIIEIAQAEEGGEDARSAPLIVELALPQARLGAPDVETQNFVAEAGAVLQLRQRFLVVRRLAERLRYLQNGGAARPRAARWGSNVKTWRDVALTLNQRLAHSGLRLMPLAPQALAGGGLHVAMSAQATGSCVHVDGGWNGDRLDQDAVNALGVAATPFACWALGAWCAADAKLLEDALEGHREEDVLTALYELQRAHGFTAHPSARLALLWDDPRRHPPSHQLGTP